MAKGKRTLKQKRSLRKSIKRRPIKNSSKKSQIVHTFIEMLNVIKLYHWKTHSFAKHKATDELYSQLNDHIDKFVEVFLGKDESRIHQWNQTVIVPQYNRVKEFKDKIYEFREFLINLNNHLDSKRDSDLLNIRDEILGDINQFLYLLTFH
jgi:DNA-binding ferritin-like protein